MTEAGLVYFDRCKRIVDEARIAHEQLGDMLAQPTGLLRVSLPVDFAVTYLAPIIAGFARQYPGITFDFDLTPRRVDLISEPFDVAIRMGHPEDSQLIGRQLAALPTFLYASPAYLKSAGKLRRPADLGAHECLMLTKGSQWTLGDGKLVEKIKPAGRFTINSVGLMRRLATLDQGVILLPHEVVADDVAAGRLVRVLEKWQGTVTPVYALTETRLLPAKTQRFVEYLQERLEQR